MNRKSTKLWALALVMALDFSLRVEEGTIPSPLPNPRRHPRSRLRQSPPRPPRLPSSTSRTCVLSWGPGSRPCRRVSRRSPRGIQPGNIQSGIDALRAFFDSAVTATQDLVAGIQAVGPPDVQGGDEIAAEFTARFEEAKVALENARSEVDNLPADDPQAFQDAANDLSLTISSRS